MRYKLNPEFKSGDYLSPDIKPLYGSTDGSGDGLYHLSGYEKRALAAEVEEFARSRIKGQACESCLGDTLFGAFAEQTQRSLNTAEAQKTINVPWAFALRARDFADHIMALGQRAHDLEEAWYRANPGRQNDQDA